MTDFIDEIINQPTPAPADFVDELLKGETPAPSQQREPFATRVLTGTARTISDIYKGAVEYVKGDSRREFDLPSFVTVSDLPELQKLRIAGAYATTLDESRIADVIKAARPDVKISSDKFGNTIVNLEGQGYYINPPGFDFKTDVPQFAAQTIQFLPSAKFAAGAKTIAGRVARGFIGGAGTSAVQDAAVQALGAEQGIDPGKAGLTGATQGLFEGLTPIAIKAWRAIFRNPTLAVRGTDGRLTLSSRGVKAAREAGLDPDDIQGRMNQVAAAFESMDPEEAASRAAANEFGLSLTSGQAKRDLQQLGREEAMRKGAFGPDAQAMMVEFAEQQRKEMIAAADRVQDMFAGGAKSIDREAPGAAFVLNRLTSRARRLDNQIDEAYEAFRNLGDVMYTGDDLSNLSKAIDGAIEVFDPDETLHPGTMKIVKKLSKLSDEMDGPLNVNKLETFRRNINAAWKATTNPADKSALNSVREAFDNWMDDAFDNSLFSGDPDALDLLKDARFLRRHFSRLFQQQGKRDEAGRVVQMFLEKNPDAEQAINYIFGRSDLGQKDVSVDVLRRLKNIFGDGDEWNAMREMAWLRLTRTATGELKEPGKFRSTIQKAFNRNKNIIDVLFTPEEQSAILNLTEQFSKTITPKEVTNPSQTAFTLFRVARDLIRRGGTAATFSGQHLLGGGLFTLGRTSPNIMAARQARRAVRPTPRARPAAPGLVAAETAVALQQEQ